MVSVCGRPHEVPGVSSPTVFRWTHLWAECHCWPQPAHTEQACQYVDETDGVRVQHLSTQPSQWHRIQKNTKNKTLFSEQKHGFFFCTCLHHCVNRSNFQYTYKLFFFFSTWYHFRVGAIMEFHCFLLHVSNGCLCAQFQGAEENACMPNTHKHKKRRQLKTNRVFQLKPYREKTAGLRAKIYAYEKKHTPFSKDKITMLIWRENVVSSLTALQHFCETVVVCCWMEKKVPVRLKLGATLLSASVNQISPRLMQRAADTSARL